MPVSDDYIVSLDTLSMDDVPRRAISMSIPQILKSAAIICTVPDSRKAEAVRGRGRLRIHRGDEWGMAVPPAFFERQEPNLSPTAAV